MKNYVILLFAIAFNAVANIMIKVGMMRAGKEENLIRLAKKAVFDPVIVGGLCCFVLALGGYSYILSKISLSIAYPLMTSLGYMIVIFVSWMFLHESIAWYQVIGFVLILSGVWLVAR